MGEDSAAEWGSGWEVVSEVVQRGCESLSSVFRFAGVCVGRQFVGLHAVRWNFRGRQRWLSWVTGDFVETGGSVGGDPTYFHVLCTWTIGKWKDRQLN